MLLEEVMSKRLKDSLLGGQGWAFLKMKDGDEDEDE